MIALFDTETTGFPNRGQLSDQPHLVQLAAVLVDDAWAVTSSYQAIIRPDGWVIPKEVSDIHGVTQERAIDEGISEAEALEEWVALVKQAKTLAAHNLAFDLKIMYAAYRRYSGQGARPFGGVIPKRLWCTMESSTIVCNLPPTEKQPAAGFTKAKAPKLAEALKILCGEEHESAHTADGDCAALIKVAQELDKRKLARLAPSRGWA
ncbi:MAG: 3'-5' exonuclease [Alphaproteobacteria bacterium]|nr:MAG: 3'-5' exonuclease [Alphaproteobacteria bacterium]